MDSSEVRLELEECMYLSIRRIDHKGLRGWSLGSLYYTSFRKCTLAVGTGLVLALYIHQYHLKFKHHGKTVPLCPWCVIWTSAVS